MSCDVGEVTESLENEQSCDVVKQRKGLRMSCDVGEVTENLENEQSCDGGEATEGLENEL